MSKICSFEMKGVIVWFRLIKPICNLKLKIFGNHSIVFEPQKDFVALLLGHSK
jgi:hypothetical protein